MNSAICITFGEQSENHVGMIKYGNRLALKGYLRSDLCKIDESIGGANTELICLSDLCGDDCDDAYVLIIRNGVDTVLGEEGSKDVIFQELIEMDWDKKYWDTRRSKVLNKRARYNLCFGDADIEPDYENKRGRVVNISEKKFGEWKIKVEKLFGEKFQIEGNYYYDLKKCGIGFHGDAERKRVVVANFGGSREIHWIWYCGGKRISDRAIVKINHGDMYIMSEKASGWDWRKRNIKTLRHAAGSKGYLK